MNKPTPTKGKLSYCAYVPVKNAIAVVERLTEWAESKLDRGYRLRFGRTENYIRVEHNDYEPVRHAIRFLEPYQNGKIVRYW